MFDIEVNTYMIYARVDIPVNAGEMARQRLQRVTKTKKFLESFDEKYIFNKIQRVTLKIFIDLMIFLFG